VSRRALTVVLMAAAVAAAGALVRGQQKPAKDTLTHEGHGSRLLSHACMTTGQ